MSYYLKFYNFMPLNNGVPQCRLATPDQLLGKICNGQFNLISPRIELDYQNNTIINYNQICDKPIILIILESPHIHEFNVPNSSVKMPVGTMKNPSTINIFNNNFINLLNNSSLNKYVNSTDYNVIIMNSVQYQCSLGNKLNSISSKKIRDENWINCYNSHCKADLINRISLIKPKIVINACTKGLKNLQLILHNDLNQYCIINNIVYTTASHPCTWNFSYAYIN